MLIGFAHRHIWTIIDWPDRPWLVSGMILTGILVILAAGEGFLRKAEDGSGGTDMNSMRTANAWVACRSRGGLLVIGFAMMAACGDATGPAPRLVGLELPDTVHLDAIRDSVRLPAELVYEDGYRELLTVGAWTGNGGDAATLHPDGWVWTRGEGEFVASLTYETLSASTVVVVRREGRVLLTFDDGWRSARTVALPALRDAGLTGSVALVVEAVAAVRDRVFTWADLYPVDQGA
jgi:hypothetical protein